MALFRRNKNESVMPEEVRDFYASEQRDRKGMAWVLAIVTLIVTFLIAALLFFGGRWAYRAIFDNNDDTSTSQEEQAEEASPAESAKKSDNDRSNSSDSSNRGTSGSNNQSGTGNSGASTGTSSTNTTQTPVTGSNELVDTGPGNE